MAQGVTVIGAGMVGVSCALALQRRGYPVTLIDRRGVGMETSAGNAGILSYGNVTPLASPELLRRCMRLLLNRETDFRLHYPHLLFLLPWLLRFVSRCRRATYLRDGLAMSRLTLPSIDMHKQWIREAGVTSLINPGGGGLKLYRQPRTYRRDALERELLDRCGIRYSLLDADEVYGLEPDLKRIFTRGVLIEDSVSLRDPEKLCQAYAGLFGQAGGVIRRQEIRALQPASHGWSLLTARGEDRAEQLVLCLGAWTPALLGPLGYRNPLAIERGYHTLFAPADGCRLSRPIFDVDASYVMAPMETGMRVTTGTDLVYREAAPDPRQAARVTPRVREAFPLGDCLLAEPWMGRRPTVPDTLPLIGAAPRHRNLWLAFAHSHMGLTLGPISGELIANCVAGEAQPFAADFCDPSRYL